MIGYILLLRLRVVPNSPGDPQLCPSFKLALSRPNSSGLRVRKPRETVSEHASSQVTQQLLFIPVTEICSLSVEGH